MNSIRVLLSDFQFLTREGLIRLFDSSPEFDLIGTHEGADGLFEQVVQLHPDVLVMDYERQDPIVLTLLKRIVESRATNILIITNDNDKASIQNLLNMGIRGIVTKGCSKMEILNAIHALAKNNRFFCNRILDVVIPQGNEHENCEPADLSPREYEVLQLITKGCKTVEIADKLHVSVHTINSHRKNILRKLNMKSPTELVVYALESGLVKG